jgi:hypothetical protein
VKPGGIEEVPETDGTVPALDHGSTKVDAFRRTTEQHLHTIPREPLMQMPQDRLRIHDGGIGTMERAARARVSFRLHRRQLTLVDQLSPHSIRLGAPEQHVQLAVFTNAAGDDHFATAGYGQSVLQTVFRQLPSPLRADTRLRSPGAVIDA